MYSLTSNQTIGAPKSISSGPHVIYKTSNGISAPRVYGPAKAQGTQVKKTAQPKPAKQPPTKA